MKNFEFNKQKKVTQRTIKISGISFTFNPLSYNTNKAIQKYINVNDNLIKKMNKATEVKEKSDLIMKSCNQARQTMNAILGAGAYEKVFGDRDIDFFENQEVMGYIFEQITKFAEEMKENYEHPAN